MASKLNPWGVCRNLCVRSRPALFRTEIRLASPISRRGLTDDTTTRPDDPNASIPQPPDAAGKEIAKQEYVRPPVEHFADNFLNADALSKLEQAAAGEDYLDDPGHKFGMPPTPGKKDKLQDRYPPVIEQVTKLLMRDGKLSAAQRNMSLVLNILRTAPAPKVNPKRPLLPGAPPPELLPLNPVLYLTLAIDSVAPLMRIQSMKGMAGGGNALEVPTPLTARQRRRMAVLWILEVVNKKKSRGSGRTQFAHRVAEEIISVVEGKSIVWDRRQTLHRLATSSRANLNHPGMLKLRR